VDSDTACAIWPHTPGSKSAGTSGVLSAPGKSGRPLRRRSSGLIPPADESRRIVQGPHPSAPGRRWSRPGRRVDGCSPARRFPSSIASTGKDHAHRVIRRTVAGKRLPVRLQIAVALVLVTPRAPGAPQPKAELPEGLAQRPPYGYPVVVAHVGVQRFQGALNPRAKVWSTRHYRRRRAGRFALGLRSIHRAMQPRQHLLIYRLYRARRAGPMLAREREILPAGEYLQANAVVLVRPRLTRRDDVGALAAG
jgi:hypothetical protein